MTLVYMLDRLRSGRIEALRRSARRSFDRGQNSAAVGKLLGLKEAATDAEMFRLGECYEKGLGALPNYARAVHWYEAAAARGYRPAMERLGDIYLSGRETGGLGGSLRPSAVKKDPIRAFHWNTRAAEGGLPEAQGRLASQYAAGLGVSPDRGLAERWFRASAEQGCASGQFGLGALYFSVSSGSATDRDAVQWFEKSAEQGHTAEQMCLAIALLDGRGIEPDAKRALQLLTQAAHGGQVEAMFRLGHLHRKDERVGKDPSMAESWLRRASIRGHSGAILALAQLLTEDLPEPDYVGAAAVLREAAESGHARAQFELGRFYAAGNGVERDFAEARRWLSKALRGGIAEAQRLLIDLETQGAAEEDAGKNDAAPHQ
jgi:TPR repeat protein